MLAIAGQTAEPNWLKFFVDTHRWLSGVLGYKKTIFLFKKNSKILFFHGQPGVL